jgi:ribosomal protein L17
MFLKGNKLGARVKIIERTLRRVVHQNPDKLRAMVEKLIDKAVDGDLAALSIIADRLDGKPTQSIDKNVTHHLVADDRISTVRTELREKASKGLRVQ